jgi:hypothetical protein
MKKLARKILPKWCQFGHWVPVYLDKLARRKTNDVVLNGPFKGIKLPGLSFASVYTPKLVGCYEREIHAEIEGFINFQPDLIVDVGAAEGYYAVGLAIRCPRAKIVTFEAELEGQHLLAKTISLNDLRWKVEQLGYCSIDALYSVLKSEYKKPGIIMDCEGGEIELLSLEKVPALSRCVILLETHEFKTPDAHKIFRERFQATHKIIEIERSQRTSKEFPFTDWLTPFLPEVYRMMAVYEHRPPLNRWLFMIPR